MDVSAKDNKLTIKLEMDELKSTLTFKLDGNILSNEKFTNDDLMSALILLDSVSQLQGYKAGELTEGINAMPEKLKKYTLEKEGLEFKVGEEKHSMKIDLSKKIPLIDLSDFYLEPEQFDMIKSFIDEGTTGNESGIVAKLAYNVELGEEESTIYIGERDKLTDSAYKSILSALEVMYGKEVANKFKSAYPKFKDGKTKEDAFTIETNYKMEDQEESVFEDKVVVKVTINNKAV